MFFQKIGSIFATFIAGGFLISCATTDGLDNETDPSLIVVEEREIRDIDAVVSDSIRPLSLAL